MVLGRLGRVSCLQLGRKDHQGRLPDRAVRTSSGDLHYHRPESLSGQASGSGTRSKVAPQERSSSSRSGASKRKGSLLPSLSDKKAERLLSSHHKPKGFKPSRYLQEVQDGDHLFHSQPIKTGLLYGLHRPPRCLLSGPDPLEVPTIPENSCLPRLGVTAFPVPGPAIWSFLGTQNLYKDHGRSYDAGTPAGHPCSPISGRLSDCRSLQSQSPGRPGGSVKDLFDPGMADQLREVRLQPGPVKDLPGHSLGLQSPDLFSPGGKTAEHQSPGVLHNRVKVLLHKKGDVGSRAVHSSHTSGKMGSGPLKDPPEAGLVLLGWPTGDVRSKAQDPCLDKEVSSLVANIRQPPDRGPLGSERSSHHHHGCKQYGLGSSFGFPMASGVLASLLEGRLVKPQGTGCGLGGPKEPVSFPPGEGCSYSIGQHDDCRLLEQAGGHKKQEPVSPLSKDLLLGRRQHQIPISGPFKRRRKYSGGFPESHHSTEGGMAVKSQGLQRISEPGRPSSDRPLCLEAESSGPSLLLARLQRPASCSGRLGPALEPSPPVRLSSIFLDPKGIKKSPTGQGQSPPDRSILAKEGLVSHPPSVVGRKLVVPSSSGRSAHPGSHQSSGCHPTSSHGVDAEWEVLRGKGLSDRVISTLQKSRKLVTSKIYQKIWNTFQAFTSDKSFSSDTVAILEFLQAGLEKGLKPSTLRVHVSALSAVLDKRFAEHPWIQRFLRAASRIQPQHHSTIPPWDLNTVLAALTSTPFEPLQDCSLRNLTLKTVFLLAITSARRVGEIQAFSFKPPYLSVLDDRIILRLHPTFLPKVVSRFHRQQEIILPSFCPNPTSEKEREFHCLDVRRCVIAYLQATQSFRKSDHLLLQFQGPNKGQMASKITIARWIKIAISTCYLLKEKTPPAGIRAHSTRAVATSWAESASTSIEQICKAATWSNPSTFFKHYKLDIVSNQDLSFGRRILSAVVPP